MDAAFTDHGCESPENVVCIEEVPRPAVSQYGWKQLSLLLLDRIHRLQDGIGHADTHSLSLYIYNKTLNLAKEEALLFF